MSLTSNLLLLCVFLLCGLRDCVSQRGRCAGTRCFALFQELQDFPGAQESCKDSGGQLFTFSSRDTETLLASLLSGVSGSYWLERPSTGGTEEEEAALQRCFSVSTNLTRLWEPCREKLDGFLCQYSFEEPCRSLPTGAQVSYSTAMGFEATHSDSFPPGTIAVAQQPGAEHPDSKHVCFYSNWLQAPWNCEVLQGGCEHGCNSTTRTCVCPEGRDLQPNGITCAAAPCGQEGDTRVCPCPKGYTQARDSKSCVDVDECEEEEETCPGENEECLNTQGSFECRCVDGFEEEDGECVNVTICQRCEHMLCDKFNGVYECVCRKGFRVSARDPTKCEMNCTERDCPARCIPNPDNQNVDMLQCFCPHGYILDIRNSTPICSDINECEQGKPCDHMCENLLGGYRCLCQEGFQLRKEYMCVPTDEEKEGGSGSTPLYPTPAGAHPASMPSYIKTGSILGISLFIGLCAALLFLLVHHTIKRCGKLEISSLKHPNMDIFYLQQVTTDTYKRLSFDKQFKNDS